MRFAVFFLCWPLSVANLFIRESSGMCCVNACVVRARLCPVSVFNERRRVLGKREREREKDTSEWSRQI